MKSEAELLGQESAHSLTCFYKFSANDTVEGGVLALEPPEKCKKQTELHCRTVHPEMNIKLKRSCDPFRTHSTTHMVRFRTRASAEGEGRVQ